MTPAEHYAEAERLLEAGVGNAARQTREDAAQKSTAVLAAVMSVQSLLVAAAQVHATLAETPTPAIRTI